MVMPKRLGGLAALAALLLPVVAFVGRERPIGCSHPRPPTPCDPGMSNPEWAMWAFWALVLIALVLAVSAAVKARLLTVTWGAVVGLAIILELIYVGAGYMGSARQPHDRVLAVAVLFVSVIACLWLIPLAVRRRPRPPDRFARS